MELAPVRQADRLQEALPLTEITAMARSQTQLCRDHPDVVLRDTRMEEDGSWRYNGASGRLSQHALGQLCTRLKLPGGGTVPAAYLARCPALLAAENLNHWLEHTTRSEQRVLVRLRAGHEHYKPTVRAVLSDRYAAVDHLPLLLALQALVERHELGVQSWSLDDEHLTLRLLLKGEHPASLKDPLRVGLHISNSEIGLGRISITALITRLVCTNGLVVKVADLGGIHRRHIGRADEDLEAVVRMAIPRVLEEADQAATRFTALRSQAVPGEVDEFLARTVHDVELPETLLPRLTGAIEGETLYDVVNAFTRVAQDFPVAERVRIETLMSRFLRPGRHWN